MIGELYSIFLEHSNICTDSRAISKNCIFFALTGENFNGNKFALNALEQGAAYAVVDDLALKTHAKCIYVNNVLATLQELAKYHRQQLQTPIIAITGSNGKTTTKELINAVLSEKYRTFATIGNLNNHIGVPLSLLSITSKHEIAIIEIGANHIGEIAQLCNIAMPDFGLITNIGLAHLDGFGSPEGVLVAKKELFDHVNSHSGTIFINGSDEKLKKIIANYSCKKVVYGNFPEANIRGEIIDASPYLTVNIKRYSQETGVVRTNLAGAYNLDNVVAAVCTGDYFGVPFNLIGKAIEDYKPQNQRSQIVETNSNILVCDYYNANPTSMEASLRNFAQTSFAPREKMVLIGEMKELGSYSQQEHQKVVDLLHELGFSKVFLVGENYLQCAIPANYKHYISSDELAGVLQKLEIKNYAILIKGSRGAKMEKVIEAL